MNGAWLAGRANDTKGSHVNWVPLSLQLLAGHPTGCSQQTPPPFCGFFMPSFSLEGRVRHMGPEFSKPKESQLLFLGKLTFPDFEIQLGPSKEVIY